MNELIRECRAPSAAAGPRVPGGDRVRVHFQVVEGTRRRTQVFEGVVLKQQGKGARRTFTVRKLSFGVGVERTFRSTRPRSSRSRSWPGARCAARSSITCVGASAAAHASARAVTSGPRASAWTAVPSGRRRRNWRPDPLSSRTAGCRRPATRSSTGRSPPPRRRARRPAEVEDAAEVRRRPKPRPSRPKPRPRRRSPEEQPTEPRRQEEQQPRRNNQGRRGGRIRGS